MGMISITKGEAEMLSSNLDKIIDEVINNSSMISREHDPIRYKKANMYISDLKDLLFAMRNTGMNDLQLTLESYRLIKEV